MNLSEFLLARIAEDEARVKDVWKRPHWAVCNTQGDLSSLGDTCDCGLPARVLAECESKRSIIETRQLIDEHIRQVGLASPDEARDARNTRAGLDIAIAALALPYADHPDYDPSWRP